MAYYQPSDENVGKVIDYFVEKVRTSGSRQFEDTVAGVSKNAGVALATAHRVIKQLEAERIITIHRPVARRLPTSYTYNADIKDFMVEKGKDSQIEYLKNMNSELIEKLEKSDQELIEVKGENSILKNKLRQAGLLDD